MTRPRYKVVIVEVETDEVLSATDYEEDEPTGCLEEDLVGEAQYVAREALSVIRARRKD